MSFFVTYPMSSSSAHEEPAQPFPVPVEGETPPAPVEPPVEADTIEIEIVVGDTLSEVSVDALGQTDWRPLYEQNRAVVGEDPNRIFPGQKLTYVGGLPLPTPPVQTEEQANTVEETVPVPPQEVAQAEAATPNFGTAIILNSAGPVAIHTQEAADRVFTQVRGASLITIGGTRGSARDKNGHPSGNALDYMTMRDVALGDSIAQYHLDNWDQLGVEYVIWRQRIVTSRGGLWKAMEDRGSATQNHMDHVHVNYRG